MARLIASVLLVFLVGCSGRLEMTTPSTQAYTTYGKPGDYAWAFLAWKVGPAWVGPSDVSYGNTVVRLGGKDAAVVDVGQGKSTHYPGVELRSVLYQIPDLAPGTYQLEVLKDGTRVQTATAYHVIVIPR